MYTHISNLVSHSVAVPLIKPTRQGSFYSAESPPTKCSLACLFALNGSFVLFVLFITSRKANALYSQSTFKAPLTKSHSRPRGLSWYFARTALNGITCFVFSGKTAFNKSTSASANFSQLALSLVRTFIYAIKKSNQTVELFY